MKISLQTALQVSLNFAGAVSVDLHQAGERQKRDSILIEPSSEVFFSVKVPHTNTWPEDFICALYVLG